MLEQVVLAEPRGFCAGVVRAIDVVDQILDFLDPPVYVYHAIVHNDHVVKRLEDRGAKFVEEVSEVPKGATLIFSAHGISPSVKEEAHERGLHVIDATCPLVTKVHNEARSYLRKNFDVLYIGHKNHQEAKGILGIDSQIQLIESVEDVNSLPHTNNDIAYLTQTTLSLDDVLEIVTALREKFPQISAPKNDDICYATQNRQNAVKSLAEETELILVVGSSTSSNSQRLVETAHRYDVPAYLVNSAEDIKPEWFNGIRCAGITSGASAPEEVFTNIIKEVLNYGNNPEIRSIGDSEGPVEFAPPYELVQLKVNIGQ